MPGNLTESVRCSATPLTTLKPIAYIHTCATAHMNAQWRVAWNWSTSNSQDLWMGVSGGLLIAA